MKMEKSKFLRLMQRYAANIAMSGSTLRNQGAKNVEETARDFLAKRDLSRLKAIQPSGYADILNDWTCSLKENLPDGAKNWGTARKAINVFMVQCFLNRYLAKEFELAKFENVLETPLDSHAAEGLSSFEGDEQLPNWTSIKGLTAEDSGKYQERAYAVSQQKGICRACLDIILWRSKKKTQTP